MGFLRSPCPKCLRDGTSSICTIARKLHLNPVTNWCSVHYMRITKFGGGTTLDGGAPVEGTNCAVVGRICQLRQQSADISGALKTKQLTELITDLDKEAVVSGAPGKKVAVIKRVVVSENVTKTALLSWVKRQVRT
eukprot:gene11025-13039_t